MSVGQIVVYKQNPSPCNEHLPQPAGEWHWVWMHEESNAGSRQHCVQAD